MPAVPFEFASSLAFQLLHVMKLIRCRSSFIVFLLANLLEEGKQLIVWQCVRHGTPLCFEVPSPGAIVHRHLKYSSYPWGCRKVAGAQMNVPSVLTVKGC